jgi:hypothetical protein
VRRLPPRTICVDRGCINSAQASFDISAPPGYSPVEVTLAILDCLVQDHGGVVTAADIRADGTGSYTVRIQRAPTHLKEE